MRYIFSITLIINVLICNAQIKYTTEAQLHSLSIQSKENIKSTMLYEYEVKSKKWRNKKRSVKIIKKIKSSNHVFGIHDDKVIKRYLINKDSQLLISTAHYDRLGNLIKFHDVLNQNLNRDLIIEYRYNEFQKADSVFHYVGSKNTKTHSFIYNQNKDIKEEQIHVYSDKMGYLRTSIDYKYSEGNISNKVYNLSSKKVPTAEISYEYDDFGNLVSSSNKYPSLLFPKEIKYEYDDFSNIIKEEIDFGNYGNESYQYIYEYDEMGNWISQIKVKNGKIYSYYERQIEYKS